MRASLSRALKVTPWRALLGPSWPPPPGALERSLAWPISDCSCGSLGAPLGSSCASPWPSRRGPKTSGGSPSGPLRRDPLATHPRRDPSAPQPTRDPPAPRHARAGTRPRRDPPAARGSAPQAEPQAARQCTTNKPRAAMHHRRRHDWDPCEGFAGPPACVAGRPPRIVP